jgi:hypothetical protein
MSAVLSKCNKYRYKLYREVDLFKEKTIAYFGINPSTADATIDDATVKKWRGFTERNNGKRFIVGNVFAYRATDVSELSKTSEPIGIENPKYLAEIIAEADVLVPCWGSRNKIPKHLRGELDNFMELLKQSGKPIFCLGKTLSGDPKHPLMLGYSTQLVEWE